MIWEIKATSQEPNLFFYQCAVHSLRDPVREGERFAKAFLGEKVPNSWNIFLGIGLGYHVKAFYRLLKERKVSPIRMICIFLDEEERRIFQIHNTDQENETEAWDLVLMEETDKIQDLIGEFAHSPQKGSLSLVEYTPIIRVFPQPFRQMRKNLEDWLAYTIQNTLTVDYFTALWSKNFLYNLPFFSPKSTLSLKGDIIVVSAGASLASNLSFLQQNKGKVPIAAVDTALGALVARGIYPDIVVSCDAQLDNYYDFFCLFPQDRLKNEGTILIGNLTQYHAISHLFARHVFFPVEGMLDDWTPLLLGNTIPTLYAGGSVSSFALSSLSYLGAERFILVGQDLENRPLTHVVSSTHHLKRIFQSTNRFHPFFQHLKGGLVSKGGASSPMMENLTHWLRDFFHYSRVKVLHKDPLRSLGIATYSGEKLSGELSWHGNGDGGRYWQDHLPFFQYLFSPEVGWLWLYERSFLEEKEKAILKNLFAQEEQKNFENKDLYEKILEKRFTQISKRILRE